MKHFLLLMLLLFPIAAFGQADKKELRFGTDTEGGAPYIFKDPDDTTKWIGYEVELAEAFGKKLGKTLVPHQNNFKELTMGLQKGDYDLAMNGMEATPDRAEKFRLSRPYYIYHLQLVVKKGETRFKNYEEAKAKKVTIGTMEDTAAERALKRDGFELNKNLKIYDGPTDAYRDLELGRIDGVLLDLPMANTYALSKPTLQYMGEPFEKGYYVLVFRKMDEALAKQFDTAIVELAKDGTLESIYRKWKLWDEHQKTLGSIQQAVEANDQNAARRKYAFKDYLWMLWEGAKVTIRISCGSMLLAVLIGLPVALARLYGPGWLKLLALMYVEFFRGIPVLFLLYVLYFGIPSISDSFRAILIWLFGAGAGLYSAEAVAMLAFGLNYAAFEAEVYRAGISSVPVGQWEAGTALGMPKPLIFRRIIFPQAMRSILPPMTNDFIALFKDTSLVSAISLVDLSKQYLMISKPGDQYLEIGLATATLYLLMSIPLGILARWLERRWVRTSS